MSRPAVIAAGCLVVLLNLVVFAQQVPTPQTPVFRSSVDLVHLDVSVLDKNRRPVRGLTEADFTVEEDSRPQAIAAFSAVDVPDPEPPFAKWMGTVSPDVQSNIGVEDPVGRLFVLLLDDAMIPPHAASLATAREVARKFLDKVTPADRVAVVFSATGRNQTFTNDRPRLLQAIDSLKSGYANHLGGWESATIPPVADGMPMPQMFAPLFDPDIQFRNQSMATLRQVAETLISAPQRRKALVFVSPGIAVDRASASIPSKVEGATLAAINYRTGMREANYTLATGMTDLFNRMRRANVTIYSVDPMGAGGLRDYVRTKAASIPALQLSADPLPLNFDWLNPGDAIPRPSDLAAHLSTLNLDFLEEAAANTGGLAVINTNDYDAALGKIFQENSSYYLIGYQQPPGHTPGSMHQLKVRVKNRPDVTVRARSGYYTDEAPKPGKGGKPPVPISPLDKAIVGAVPNGAFPLRVALAPVVVPGRKTPTVTIVLGLEQPPVSSRTMYTVELQTNAYSPDGRPRVTGRRHTARVVLVPTSKKNPARYDLLSDIDLPPGQYELRLSAHRGLDNVSGSLYADVDVPDFTNAPLSVSGVMVEVVPTNATAPQGAFDAYLPIVPTSTRDFQPNDEASAFLRIYQGGTLPLRPATVSYRLQNDDDALVREGRDQLASDRFYVGGRAADYKLGIPVSRLPPARYLLTLDVFLGGETIRRSVQFTVLPRTQK